MPPKPEKTKNKDKRIKEITELSDPPINDDNDDNNTGNKKDSKNKNKAKKNQIITISIEPNKKKKDKKITRISWNSDYNPFPNINLKEIESDLRTEFKTSCTKEDNCSFVLHGPFIIVKKYLIEHYDLKDNQFRINFKTNIVPTMFNVTLHTKLGSSITRISWPTKIWSDSTYNEFVDQFKKKLSDFKLKSECNKTNDRIEFLIQGYCIKDFSKYFEANWKMKEPQVIIIEEKRDPEVSVPPENTNYKIKNPYNTMINKFNNIDYDDTYTDDGRRKPNYYREMSETIQEAYRMDLHKLKSIEIKTNLKFEKLIRKKEEKEEEETSKDEEIEDNWITKFNVLSRFSIDGIQNGRFLFNGDKVVVTYKERNGTIEGTIISNIKGEVTAIFKLKEGQLPPGVTSTEEEENNEIQNVDNDKIEEEEKLVNNDDDDDDDDDEEEDDENDDEKNPYTITFKPNTSAYERYALGLLILDSMNQCPIKKIIENNHFDRSINEIKGVDVEISNRMEFEPKYLNELTEEERKKITVPLTLSQKECVELILKNHISIVHGPPGCGKTFSIGLFVYHLLKQSNNPKKRILLCAYSRQAVESIVSYVSPVAKALNKNLLWLRMDSFDCEEDFVKATEEQKCSSVYKIMNRKESEEVYQFKRLQKKKWNSKRIDNLKSKSRKNKLKSDDNNRFTASDQNQMYIYQSRIEKNLVYEADIVCCSIAISGKKNLIKFDFKYVIIDEASQADQMTSLVPLIHHPSKIVLLGDHNQLDAKFFSELKQSYPHTTQSLYQKLHNNQIQHKMLKTQFRMNESICEFPNQEFYKGLIISAKFLEDKTKVNLKNIPTPIAFIDVKDGVEEKDSGITYKNKREAEVVYRILKNFKMNKISGDQIGVITPYHGQVEILREKLNEIQYKDVRISSVDHFQGCERNFIIISMVRTNKNGHFGFIADKHRLNVTLTRARKGLIIVGNYDKLSTRNREIPIPENEVLIRLCEFYKNKHKVIESNSIKELTKPVVDETKLENQNESEKDDYFNESNESINKMDIISEDFDMSQISEVVNDNDDGDFGEEYDIQNDDGPYYDDMKDLIQ